MATSIHHGPPGSFKSFTLVQRFAIDALKEGRVVITNIRGLTSIDRIQDQFPDAKFPESSDLWFIDTEIAEGRALMAGWFHWVPLRALIIIDECQRIYPNRREFKMESLDVKVVPTGYQVEDIAIEIVDEYTGNVTFVHRPEDVFTAYDMQRHFQWDVFISTPNIAKIKDPIREVAESAYRHKSLSGKLPKPLAKLLGFYNAWYEFQHDPETSGKLASQVSGKPRKYKADERVFKCYQSTATGEHTESKADQSILGDPKLKMLLVVIVLAIGNTLYSFIFHADELAFDAAASKSGSPAVIKDTSHSKKDSLPARYSASGVTVGYVPNEQNTDAFSRLGYQLLQVVYQRLNEQRLLLLADTPDGLQVVDYQEIEGAGIRVSNHGLCSVTLIAPDGALLRLTCASAVVRACASVARGSDFVSYRDCHKYGELKEPVQIQPALLAATDGFLKTE